MCLPSYITWLLFLTSADGIKGGKTIIIINKQPCVLIQKKEEDKKSLFLQLLFSPLHICSACKIYQEEAILSNWVTVLEGESWERPPRHPWPLWMSSEDELEEIAQTTVAQVLHQSQLYGRIAKRKPLLEKNHVKLVKYKYLPRLANFSQEFEFFSTVAFSSLSCKA